jgi:hypothetical protein
LIAIIFRLNSLKLFFCFWFSSLFSSQLSNLALSSIRLTVFTGTSFQFGCLLFSSQGILQLVYLLSQLGTGYFSSQQWLSSLNLVLLTFPLGNYSSLNNYLLNLLLNLNYYYFLFMIFMIFLFIYFIFLFLCFYFYFILNYIIFFLLLLI